MPEGERELFPASIETTKSRHIYQISELTQELKRILEQSFGEIWVEGEISNFRVATSGHFYFTLKDENAILNAAMFLRANKEVKFKISDGLKVICLGRLEVYGPRGHYQLIVEKLEPKGIGAQQLAFEQLKNKLFKEGLFAPQRKKELPLMPFRLGVVTSLAGAAIQDLLQILKKGAPALDVLIRSVRVQGESAPGEIVEAISDFNAYKKVDLIVLCRGGGSSEDLWAFNAEGVARAVAHSSIPTISAVGHQINVTLADLAADVFVETPSAAAKIIVDKKNALLTKIESCGYEMNSAISKIIHNLTERLSRLKGMLKSPADRLLEKEQFLDELTSHLNAQIKHILEIAKGRFLSLSQRLETLSPLGILSRGYSLSLLLPEEVIIKDAAKLKTGDAVKTILEKGAFLSRVEEVLE